MNEFSSNELTVLDVSTMAWRGGLSRIIRSRHLSSTSFLVFLKNFDLRSVWPGDQIVKNCPKAYKLCQCELKTLPQTKLTLNILAKMFKYLPKWSNVAKSSHTVCLLIKNIISAAGIWTRFRKKCRLPS